MLIQLTLAARYLWGRKLRTVLTTVAIVFGVLVIFGMNILLPTILNAFQTSILTATGQVDVTITSKTGDTFSTRILDKVESLPGIKVASGSLQRTINIPADYYRRGNVGALSLIGLEPKSAQQLRDYTVSKGRFVTANDSGTAVITQGLADSLGLTLGDELSIPTPQGAAKLKIVGLRPAQSLPGSEPVYVSLAEAQKLLGLSNQINTIDANLNTSDPAQREVIRKEIQAQLGSEYELNGLGNGSDIFASLQTAQQAFNLLGFLALFMGGFIIFNTFRTIVAERRHDIGMLRAIGAGRRMIIGMFLIEGLIQGIIGTAIGMGLGYLLGLGITVAVSALLSQYLHVQIGAPVIEPQLVVITLLLGIGVTLLSGLIPAWRASRVSPLEALRPAAAEVETQKGISKTTLAGIGLMVLALAGLVTRNISLVALGGLLFLVGVVLIAPALVKPLARVLGGLLSLAFPRDGTSELAEGNLTRQPSRAAITASATMIGLAIIVAVIGLISSLTGSIGDVVQKSIGSDYLLIPPAVGVWGTDVGADATLADRLRSLYGVGAVSTMRFATTSINNKQVNVLAIDPKEFPKVSGLSFQQGDPTTAFSLLGQGRYVIVNGLTATQLGIKPGYTILLSSPEGEEPYVVAAVANDYLNTKLLTAYLSQDNLKRDFHKTDDVFIQFNLAPGADAATVEPRIKDAVSKYPQFNLISGRAYSEQILQLFNASFALFYVLVLVLALPSLIAILNTLAIGVIERTREIGMLRAIGATRGQVRRTVLIEALLLAATGTAFGIVAGLYLGYVFVLGISASGLYQVQYAFPFTGVLVGVAVGLIFGVIAALIPARQAARMDILQALQYE